MPRGGVSEFVQKERVPKKEGISASYVHVTVCLALSCDDKRKEAE